MRYVEMITRMNVLGDALQLALPAKAMSETLLLRAHYAKGMNEWQTMCEQVGKDMPREEEEDDAAYLKRLNDMLAPKSEEEAPTVSDRRYSKEAFEAVCAAAIDAGEVLSSVHLTKDYKPAKVPAWLWLEYLAANIVTEE